ncbi:MAG: hypothetical protein ROO73_01795 [Roseivirga sp.]
MNRVNILGQLVSFLYYITLQIVLARSIMLFHTAFCFIYVAFLLLLPWRPTGLTKLLVVGFCVGLLIDAFYDSWGLHAFASVLLIYCRALLLQLMLPVSDYEVATQPTLRNLGWKRFSLFALMLISMHHLALFALDAYDTTLVLTVLRKTAFSTLLTYIAVLLTQSATLLASNK